MSGAYGVTVTDATGCSSNTSYTVNQVGSIPINATPTSSLIQSGESVQLNATGGISYVWTPAEGLNCTDCSNPVPLQR